MYKHLLVQLQKGSSSMQLAVLGGHTDVVQELADKSPLSIKFTTQVRSQLVKQHLHFLKCFSHGNPNR